MHDERLMACIELRPHLIVRLGTARYGTKAGSDGLSPGGTLAQFRDIEIPVRRHRQRPWDRRRRHHQQVGVETLLGECTALEYTEPMLLVDDRKAQILERHPFLQERMRPDGKPRAAVGDARHRFAAGAWRKGAGQQQRREARTCKQARYVGVLLFGQHLGG